MELLVIYKHYSDLVSSTIAERGAVAARQSNVKTMRAVKRHTLKLLQEFTNVCDDLGLLCGEFFPQLLTPILEDYVHNVPDAREAEVLSLFAALILRLREQVASHVPNVLTATFECTLSMITKNMEDFPDHRLNFFELLQAIVSTNFEALTGMSE